MMRSQIVIGSEENDMSNEKPLQVDQIGSMIRTIRGQKVILDHDLARIFGVPTFRFNEAIKRNRDRFPDDFLFQLTREEQLNLISQFATLKICILQLEVPIWNFKINNPDAILFQLT